MEKSVLLVVLIVGVFVFGEFKHAIAERSGGKYHLPQRGKPNSPSYAPMHSPKSQSPHHPPYSSLSMVPGPSVLPSIHHSSAPSIRTFTSTSRSPSFFKPGMSVAPSIRTFTRTSPSPSFFKPRMSVAPSIRTFTSTSPSPSPSFFKPGMSVAPMASICKCTAKSIFACFSECISPGPSPSQSFLKAAKSVAPVATMSTTLQQTKPLKSTRHEIQHLKVLIIVAIALVLLILGAIIILFTYWTCTWVSRSRFCPVLPSSQPPALRKQSDIDDSDANNGMSLGPSLTRFSSFRTGKRKGCASAIEYSVLQAATNNFSSYNLLGQGGFGSVYRAQFPDDFCVAVKMLDENRKQADDEFQSEVELMSKIRHPNLVSLLGFCVHGKRRLLVYELMQNGSLEAHLHGPSHGSALTWHLRMKIALDTARGLEHLHDHCNSSIIHSDFKSANILLDASFNAKLSDFGLAVRAGGHMCSTDAELLGTLGYLAPEYLSDGKLTEKSDVYAFGVVLLELITGRKPVDKSMPAGCQSLVTWAKPQLTDRSKLPTIVDPMIKETVHLKHLYQVAAVAVVCVQTEPDYRPLITDVVHSLMPLVPVELGGALKNAKALSDNETKSLVAANLSTKTTGKTEL